MKYYIFIIIGLIAIYSLLNEEIALRDCGVNIEEAIDSGGLTIDN